MARPKMTKKLMYVDSGRGALVPTVEATVVPPWPVLPVPLVTVPSEWLDMVQ